MKLGWFFWFNMMFFLWFKFLYYCYIYYIYCLLKFIVEELEKYNYGGKKYVIFNGFDFMFKCEYL